MLGLRARRLYRLALLHKIVLQQERIMAALENLNAAIDGVVAGLGNLRDDVVTLRDEVALVVTLLKKPGVSDADIQAAADKLAVAKSGLDSVDADFDAVTDELKKAADAVTASGGAAG